MEKTKNILKVVALLAFSIGVSIVSWSSARIARGAPAATPNPTYSELVAIVLTAVTVVLGVLAVVIGILALWGYNSIKGEASSIASRIANEAILKHVDPEVIKSVLHKEAVNVARETQREMAASYAAAFPTDQINEANEGSIAEEYPKRDGDNGQASS